MKWFYTGEELKNRLVIGLQLWVGLSIVLIVGGTLVLFIALESVNP